MTTQNILNVSTPPTFQQPNGSAELQEWLECKDFVLGMKGIHVGHLPVDTTSMRHCTVSVNHIFTLSKNRNKKINQQLDNFNTHWLEAIGAALTIANEVDDQIADDIVTLNFVDLADKREVLRHMQIIPTPIASAYLGISEDALHEMKKFEHAVFGEHYAGAHCYSMEELNLIARNPHWTVAGIKADYNFAVSEVEVTALDQAVMVDEEVAAAFTNMTPRALMAAVTHTSLARRPYRLADLEKVRLAKMRQPQF